jgi:hypothetical protein
MTLYLDYIAKAWKSILRCGDTILPFSAVDAVTVQSLELLAPKHSDIDKSLVIDLMERGEIFPSQNDQTCQQTSQASHRLWLDLKLDSELLRLA